jgi:uncharacterized membrane protein
MELETIKNQPESPEGKLVAAFKGEFFEGPLPNPEMLAGYKNIDPSFPDRIVKMAENHNIADVKMKKGFVFSNTVIPIAGQIFTFLLGAGSLCVCVYLANKGLTGGAIAAVIAGFAPIIINALKSFRQNGHSKQNDDSQYIKSD